MIRKTFLTDFLKIHYSQFGEDVILKELIDKNEKKGFYVDVGCYHPKKFSNTYMLHKRGWSGINIDLEKDKIFCFKLARPNDHNVISAISNTEEIVSIYRDRKFSLGTTVNKELAEESKNKREFIKLKTKTLDHVIESSPFKDREIDVLSIDAEGHDWEVLQSIDLKKYVPKVIVIESQDQVIEDIIESELYTHLTGYGYQLYSWTHLSLIFVKPNASIFNKMA